MAIACSTSDLASTAHEAGATVRLRKILLGIALSLTSIDVAWILAAHLRIVWLAYLNVILLSAVLLGTSEVYRVKRPDPRLSAMLFGAGFLCLFTAAASVLNYCLLTVAGPSIDPQLAAIDRALGFDWPALMSWVAPHRLLTLALQAVYISMLPQVALLTVALAGQRTYAHIYRFCAAVAVGALVCIGVWTLMPSFGAMAVYAPPPNMPLALDQNYARQLTLLLANGPGLISPADTKGLIGFPSYHAVLALLVMFYGWKIFWLRWPVVVFNLAVLAATPIQGGHHLVDVLGGIAVTVLTLYAVNALEMPRKMGQSFARDPVAQQDRAAVS
jgi:hypothetical protein